VVLDVDKRFMRWAIAEGRRLYNDYS
jgi:hypothetical protein